MLSLRLRPLTGPLTAAFTLLLATGALGASPEPGDPIYHSLRYDDDFSYLADPMKSTDFWDPIKYIPIGDGQYGPSYLSLGGEVRERFEILMGGTDANGFRQGVTTSGVNNDASFQSALYNTPSATDITLGADGNLYYNNANGSMGAEITAQPDGSQTDLDGAGGGLIGGTGPAGTTASAFTAAASTGDMQQTINQLLGLLGQNQHSFYSIMMMQTLSRMMSQSGYAQA